MVEIGIGTISSNTFDMKQIFEEVLKIGMNKFILVHNHPSGDASPSKEDIALTQDVINAAALFSIRVHDHIIIGKGGTHFSLRTNDVI